MHYFQFLIIACLGLPGHSLFAEEIEPIPRRLPPVGLALTKDQVAPLEQGIADLEGRLGTKRDPNIEIFSKAIRYAVSHREFYQTEHLKIPAVLFAEANRRLVDNAWATPKPGLLVRGYRSEIDGSAQPYGLEIPEGLDLSKPVPLWVWLHGRGDKETDLYFIYNRMKKHGQFRPDNAIVIHPFGRQCVGWKWAGELDVFEALEDVSKHYKIDQTRIGLLGFSMGGAGAWHIGAHYSDRFAAVHPGAGFAETREYNKLTPQDYPPSYEQTLWGLYDVPAYARNFLNVPLTAYSGENDRQIQAARVMEAALKTHGHELHHVIGPKMGHKYDPESRQKIQSFVQDALAQASGGPRPVSLQTRTLRYAKQGYIEITGMKKHWEEARVDSRFTARFFAKIETKNVTSLRITKPKGLEQIAFPGGRLPLEIDGQSLNPRIPADLVRSANGRWTVGFPEPGLRKSPHLQGPIDDAFMAPFLFVTPTGTSNDANVQDWVEFELDHQVKRWRALFRGDVRAKPADKITDDDVLNYNLILWGDQSMNPLVRETLAGIANVQWDEKTISVGGATHASTGRVLTLIYPNPRNPKRYVVLNSGPTFREAHDRTNSLQNPKLPDWAVIGLDQPPSAGAPGKILAAGFFDEAWNP